MTSERRDQQRLRLPKPVLGNVEDAGALVLDVSMGGALVEHYGEYQNGDQFHLRFAWEDYAVEMVCEVTRSVVVRTASDGSKVSHTAIKFVAAVGQSEEILRGMISAFVQRMLAAQRSNAHALIEGGDSFLLQLGDARRARSRGYVSYELQDGNWSKVLTSSPRQPPDGFTVAAHEDEDELQLLCDAYLSSGPEGRVLIRLLAELSSGTVLLRE